MKDPRVATLLAVAPAVWLAVFTVVDLLSSRATVFTVLLGVAPLIACAFLSARLTTFYAVAATALAVVSGGWTGTFAEGQYFVRVADVALISVAAVLIAHVRVRREAKLERVTAIAEAAQRAMLPTIPPEVNGLRIATRYESAMEEALVGGDLYDLHRGPQAVRLLIGDVRGKGLTGVAHAARVIRAFRQAAAADPRLADVAREMNEYLTPFFSDEDFVTAVLVEIPADGTLTFVGCGHPRPLIVSDGHVMPVDEVDGVPLGLATDFTEVTRRWRRGDRLLLYTDGLVEARDPQGRFLPQELIDECARAADPEEALERLLASLDAHVPSGRTDDLALVVVDNVSVGPEPLRAEDAVGRRGTPAAVVDGVPVQQATAATSYRPDATSA